MLKRRQISHFLTPVKIRGGVSELHQLLKLRSFTYDRTSGIHLMSIQCAAAEHGGLLKKEEKSLRVKLKVTRPTGRVTK